MKIPRSQALETISYAARYVMAWTAITSACLAADSPAHGLIAARDSISKLKPASGLSVSLFAAEPMVQNPTNLDIDSKGRIWFTEAANYRKWSNPPIRPEGDRIMTLEDSDGDGEADRATIFYQDPSIDSALGICVLGNQVIVSVAPHVFLLTDEDGDGKADSRKLLLTGRASPQHDHSLHAFVFGSDGKLYFNFGNTGSELRKPTGPLLNIPLHGPIPKGEAETHSEPIYDLLGRPLQNGGKPYHQGMVFRADFNDGKLSNFETLAHNFRNNYEVTVDSFGNLWQSDNDDDGNRSVRINYLLEHGNYGYRDELTGSSWQAKRINLESDIPKRHWHQSDPGVVPNLLVTGGGSPTGILFNEGTRLGPALANSLIHCDAGPRVVRAYSCAPDGAGFKAEIHDLLTSSDTWFRPSDVALAPDGSLFVADWYDANVGGHNMADNDPKTLRGRIYRIAQIGDTRRPSTPDFSTASGAVHALQSPNRDTQFRAWQRLRQMGKEAQPALEILFKSEDPRIRARALAVLSRIPGIENRALETALADKDPGVVILAIRLATAYSAAHELDTSVLESKPGLVAKLLRHPEPQVRRQIAISLHGAKQIAELWAALAMQHDGKDRWYLEALGIGAAGQEDACFDAWIKQGGDPRSPAGKDIVWRLRSARCADPLAQLVVDRATPEDEKPRLLRAFDFQPESAEKRAALLQIATRHDVSLNLALHALIQLRDPKSADSAEIHSAVENALKRTVGTPEFVQISAAFGLGNRSKQLFETLQKIAGTVEAGTAIEMLEKSAEGSSLINAALSGESARDYLELFASIPSKNALKRVLSLISSPDVETRRAAVRALAKTQAGAETLLALDEEKKFPEDLRDTASRALELIQFNDRDNKLQKALSQHFPASRSGQSPHLPSANDLSRKKGDPVRGKEVFARAESSCVVCHKIGNLGADFGPNLSEIGTKLGRDALFEAILNPNNGISVGFETYLLKMQNGTPASGIIRSENETEVILALPGGISQRISKFEIKGREKLPHSLMPSGLGQILGEQNLVDLVEYLSSCKAK